MSQQQPAPTQQPTSKYAQTSTSAKPRRKVVPAPAAKPPPSPRQHRSSSSASTAPRPQGLQPTGAYGSGQPSTTSSTSSLVVTSPSAVSPALVPSSSSSSSSTTSGIIGTPTATLPFPAVPRHHRNNSSGSIRSMRSFTEPSTDTINQPTRFPTTPTPGEIYDTLEREQEAIVNKLQKEIAHLRNERSRSRSRSTSSSTSISRHPSTRSVYSLSDTEDHHFSGHKNIASGAGHAVPPVASAGTANIATPSSSSSSSSSSITIGLTPGSSGTPVYQQLQQSAQQLQPSQQPAGSGSTAASSITTPRPARKSFGSVSEDSPILLNLRKENDNLKKRLADLTLKLAEKDKEIERLKNAK
ncbi:uncharacterized protein SAPINGB_P003012 [Magnusiomyces paraingens]|uniref:Uncharacterized protein n=1 Tax=Magnusiomyces paraingens TaxID=2606893 RepID=A0A5E8BNU2_9ASCO|nr:uncharacterized protein SAPINGB_P003012 [Saprochaete ingens]VVT51185.1 unnamed protein product [Saprochaete ingens]